MVGVFLAVVLRTYNMFLTSQALLRVSTLPFLLIFHLPHDVGVGICQPILKTFSEDGIMFFFFSVLQPFIFKQENSVLWVSRYLPFLKHSLLSWIPIPSSITSLSEKLPLAMNYLSCPSFKNIYFALILDIEFCVEIVFRSALENYYATFYCSSRCLMRNLCFPMYNTPFSFGSSSYFSFVFSFQ